MTSYHFRDVRMRGFEKRARLAEVLDWLDQQPFEMEPASQELFYLCGKILAEDIVAPRNVPPFRRSAMDGYALRGEDTVGASDYSPLKLEIVGESWPGKPCHFQVEKNQAVRIMTGAPVPEGADAVLPAEQVTDDFKHAEITSAVPPGKNVGAIGEDLEEGDTVLRAGRRLRPQDVGILAAMGLDRATIRQPPKVRILVTGNELGNPGQPINPYQIYDSNSHMLKGLIQRDGGIVESTVKVPDAPQFISKTLTDPGADVILVSGGSSVGAEDHAPSLVEEHGSLNFHGIAMRPASPAGVGKIGNTLVVLLPGNPVSCLCAYDLIAGRAIRARAGQSKELPYQRRRYTLSKKLVSSVGRLDYCRIAIENDRVIPLSISGASMLSSTSRADGFVMIPEEREGYPEGASVDVYLYDDILIQP